MELEITDVEGDAYQNFVDSVRGKETLRKYDSYLNYFLKLIPNSMYKRYLGYEPRSREVQDLASAFTEIAKKNVKIAKSIIQAYVRDLKKQIDEKTLSPATAKNRLKPIKALLKSNDIEISWYLVDKSLPRPGKSKDRAYTREELQMMMKKAVDLTDKVIITCASSGGFRVEAWNYFTWSDLRIFYDDKTIKGGALRVYHGDVEEYWTHITPEACKYLLLYKENWKKRFFKYPEDKDPLIAAVKNLKMTRLGMNGVRTRALKFVGAIGMRPLLENGERRHTVMLDHGFRKYQNTMMRRAKVDFADKEDMQGRNPGGQEKSYERYEEADFERFAEYQKAIPFLTISEEERAVEELRVQKVRNDELENANDKLQNQDDVIKKMEEKIYNITKEVRDNSDNLQDDKIVATILEILKNKNLIKDN